jgi:hypothetical protein
MPGPFESQTEVIRADWWEEGEYATIRRWDTAQRDGIRKSIADLMARPIPRKERVKKIGVLLFKEALVRLSVNEPSFDDMHFVVQQIIELNRLKEDWNA